MLARLCGAIIKYLLHRSKKIVQRTHDNVNALHRVNGSAIGVPYGTPAATDWARIGGFDAGVSAPASR
jgi:hypothetical protein